MPKEVHSRRIEDINGEMETLKKLVGVMLNGKATLNDSRARSEKIRAQTTYTEAIKMVTKHIRTDKRTIDRLG